MEEERKRPAFLGKKKSSVRVIIDPEEIEMLKLEAKIMIKTFIYNAARSKDGLTRIAKKFSIQDQEIIDSIREDFDILQQKIHQEKITTKINNLGSYIGSKFSELFADKSKARKVEPIEVADDIKIIKATAIDSDAQEVGIRLAKKTAVHPDETLKKIHTNSGRKTHVNAIYKKISKHIMG